MRVLVVGATGVLGRRVVRRLLAADHDVAASARNAEAKAALTSIGAEPVDVDVFNRASVMAAVRGSDAVLRLTTKIPSLAHMRRADAWIETGRLRTESARLFADACVAYRVGAYVHESVTFVYADRGDAWIDEGSPIAVDGVDPLEHAFEGEASVERVNAAGGRGIVLRFAGFYSEDSTQSIALATALQHRRIALFGRARNYFSSIHVDDAAAAVVSAMSAPAGIYNVSDLEPLRFIDYIAAIATAIDAPPLRRLPKFTAPAFVGLPAKYLFRSLRVSSQKLRDTTGWTPAVPDAREGWNFIVQQWAAEGQR